MKYLPLLMFSLFFMGLTNFGASQTKIIVKGVYNQEQNSNYLRWIPANYKQMKHANMHGYTINRVQTHISESKPLSQEEINATLTTFNVLPFTTSEWETLGENQDSAKINTAKFLMSELPIMVNGTEEIKLDTLNIRKLSHAYHYHETQVNQYDYSLLLADQDFEIAKGMGMALVDSDITFGASYRYTITLNQKEDFILSNSIQQFPYAGVIEISTSSDPTLIAPKNLTAEPSDKIVRLSWDVSGLDDYTYFNIYRSVSNGPFVKVNDNPYIFMSQDEKAVIVSYNDSIPQNGVPYTYRVTGLSPFGGESPYSTPITVTGVPDPLPLAVEVKSLESVDTLLIIKWRAFSKLDSLPPSLSNVLKYEVLHTTDLDATPILVKTKIDSTATIDSIPNPTDGYYFVAAVDANGYRYPSIPHFYQAIDSIAPTVPLGLAARLNIDGAVRLTWTANTEADLQGYRVFYSYYPDGPFTQTTSTPVAGTTYITKKITGGAQDTVYYAIRAVDKRENTSEMSTSVMLLLPDNIAPSAPVLAQLLPRPEGIRIGWALSGESDVDVHFLQRKFMDATQWDNILRIDRPSDFPPLPISPAEVNASNYIDTDSLQMSKYTYRIITYDLSGNFSTSKVYEVKPYDDGLRGHIRPFKAKLKNQGQYYIANPTSPGPGGSQADITNTNLGVHNLQWVKGSVMSDGKVAELTWEYDTKHPSSLQDFSIYQKVHNPQLNPTIATVSPTIDPNPFVLIRTVSKIEAIRIATANGKKGYMVHVEGLNPQKLVPLIPVVQDPKAGTTGTGKNPTSQNVSSPFEYKIIANHRGGGWSHEAKAMLTKSN